MVYVGWTAQYRSLSMWVGQPSYAGFVEPAGTKLSGSSYVASSRPVRRNHGLESAG